MAKYQPGLRVSEYLLEEWIGSGAFGEVWRARHHVWEGEHVAVKLPAEPEYMRYLQREGQVVHGLRHVNIVRVIGLDPYADVPYLVMELVRGPSLKQVIADHPKGLPLPAVLTITHGILRAMVAAHAGNVLHRDLKPGNVMLHMEGRGLDAVRVDDVKVGDFGFGMRTTDTLRSIAQSVSIARDDQLVGTLAYMAPELRDGNAPPDAGGDLYAIGVMLFELLTGERPAGAELPSVVRAETPAGLDRIFSTLYARRDRRYASAQAALDDLLTVAGSKAPPPPPPPPGEFYDVWLQVAGPNKIALIAAVRAAWPNLGLAEAKSMVDGAPRVLLARTDRQTGGDWVERLQALGAQAALRRAGTAASSAAPPAPPTSARSTCPSCRAPTRPDDQYCTGCGLQIAREVRRCPSCQGYPGQRDRFCIHCGTALA